MTQYTTCGHAGCANRVRTRQRTGLCKTHYTSGKSQTKRSTPAEYIPAKLLLLHTPSVGIDAEDLSKGPAGYVRQLARYIRDPSTIYARCKNEWGSAPSIERIRAAIAAADEKRRAYRAESDRLGESDEDAEDFRVRPTLAAVVHQEAEQKKAANVLHFDAAAIMALPHREVEDSFINSTVIIEKVAKVMKVTVEDILGPSRSSAITRVRKVICYILRQRGWSYPRIAIRLNRKDHTTARYMAMEFDARADERMRWVAAQFDMAPADESEAA